MTPGESVAAECGRRGRDQVVVGCAALLEGRSGDVDDALISALGGRTAAYVLAGNEGGKAGYWPRVWAVRGLLYAWDGAATAALLRAADDDSWRVREMMAKVVARHRVLDAYPAMVVLREDENARVRAAAERALARIAS